MKYLLGLLLVGCISCTKTPDLMFNVGDCIRSQNDGIFVVIEIGKYAYKVRSYRNPGLILSFNFVEQTDFSLTDCFAE